MPQSGGHWKATNNTDIVERHPDGGSRIRFRPVAAHLTPIAMADLIRRYRLPLDQHVWQTLVGALAILDFCASTLPGWQWCMGNGAVADLATAITSDYAETLHRSPERIFEESAKATTKR